MEESKLEKFIEEITKNISNENFKFALEMFIRENADKEKEEIIDLIKNDDLLSDFDEFNNLFLINKRKVSEEQKFRNLLEEFIVDYDTPSINDKLAEIVKRCFEENKTLSQTKKEIRRIFGRPERKEEIKKAVFGETDDGKLFHEINVNGVLKFILEDGTITDEVYINGERHLVQDGEEVLKGVVLLSDGIENYGSKEELIEELRDFIHRYVDVSPEFERWTSFYIMLSWLYDKFNTIPYLRVLGDTGTGKSRFLEVALDLCMIPIRSTGASSPSATFRLIERWKGTLGIDEGDLKKSDETADMIKILNNGFQKDKYIVKVDKNNPSEINTFRCFGPKVITTRKTFYDTATESRCITEIMRETDRDDIPDLLPKEFYEKSASLRRKLLKFRFDYFKKIDPEIIHYVDLKGIEPRLRQASRSFVVLFSDNEKELNKYREWLMSYNDELREERANSGDGRVITAIIQKLKEGELDITPKDIKEILGDKWSAHGVGKALRRLGLKTQPRRSDKSRKRFLVLDKNLVKVLKRYMKIGDFDEFTTIMGQKIGKNGEKWYRFERFEHFLCPQLTHFTQLGKELGNSVQLPQRNVQNVHNVHDLEQGSEIHNDIKTDKKEVKSDTKIDKEENNYDDDNSPDGVELDVKEIIV